MVIQSAINSFGSVVMAANAAAMSIEGFVFVAMNAFHQAAVSFISQNVGAGKFGRINKIVWCVLLGVTVTGLVLGGMAVLFGKELLTLYSTKPEVIVQGMIRLKWICSFYALCGIMDVMVGVLRGLGYSVMPMIVSLLGACGLRLLWIFTVFRIPEYHTTKVLYLSYAMSWTITIFVHAVCFLVVRRKFPKENV